MAKDLTSKQRSSSFHATTQYPPLEGADSMYLKVLAREQKAREEAEASRDKLYRLQYVTTALSQALTPSRIAEIVVSLGAASLHADSGTVWLFNKNTGILELSASTGYSEESLKKIQTLRSQKSTPTLDAIRTKKPIILRNLEERKKMYPHTLKVFMGTKREAFIALPLMLHGNALGAMNFAFKAKKDFTSEEQEFIYTLTQQCVQALERASLYEDEKTAREEADNSTWYLNRLLTISTSLSLTATQKDVAKTITEDVLDAVGGQGAALYLLNNDILDLTAFSGFSQKVLVEKTRISITDERYPMPKVLKTIENLYIEDAVAKPRYPFLTTIAISSNLRSFAVLPVVSNKKNGGVLIIGYSEAGPFSDEEKKFLETVAQQCGQILERARLYEEEQKKSEALQEVVQRLDSVQDLASVMSQAVSPLSVAQVFAQKVSEIMHAPIVEVGLIDTKKEVLQTLYSLGHKHEFLLKEIDLAHTGYVSMEVIKSGNPFFIENIKELQNRFYESKKFFLSSGVISLASIPLINNKKVSGVLNFGFKKEKIFSQDEKEFIFYLSEKCIQALDRAHLYEEEKRQKDELSYAIDRINSLQEVTSKLANAVTPLEMGNIILDEGIGTLHGAAGEVSLLSEDGKRIKMLCSKGYPQSFLNKLPSNGTEISTDKPLLMVDVIKSKKSMIVSDFSKISKKYQTVHSIIHETGFTSGIFFPIKTKNKIVGALALFFNDSESFRQEDVDFTEALVKQYGQGLDRAYAYDKEKKYRKTLEQTLDKLNALQTITSLFSKALKPKDIGQVVINNGVEVLGALGGEIVEVSEDEQKFILTSYGGYPKRFDREFKKWREFNINKPLLFVDVLKSGKPLFVNDIYVLPKKYKTVFEFAYRSHCRAEAIVPLIFNTKIIGVLSFIFSEVKSFTLSEKQFILALAEQYSQAFERARIYEQQEKIAQELEKREARFRALIENSSDAIVLIDKKGIVLYSSPSTFRITGSTPEERQGKSVYAHIIPQDVPKAKDFLRHLIKYPSEIVKLRYRRMNKDGTIPWMEAVGTNQLNNPDIKAIVINYRNITDVMDAENALKESKDELDIIFQTVADAVVVWNAKKDISYVNKAAIKLNRYSSLSEFMKDMTYNRYLDRFSEITNEQGNALQSKDLTVGQAIKQKKTIQHVMRCVFKDTNEEQWRRVTSSPVINPSGEVAYIVSVSQDVTEEKKKEQLKDEFISTASHELKTPITSAKLYAGMLAKRLQLVEDSESFQVLGKIDTQLDRLTKLITDLLDVTKIRSGKLTIQREKVDIDLLVREVVEEMQYTTFTHHLRVSGVTGEIISVDKERIRQVLLNLLINAIKYSPKSEKIDIVLGKNNGNVTICVKDYGMGISAEGKEKIFEPFYRENLASGSRVPGLGLGLHISLEIIKKHGGTITVESIVGKGSRFCIALPLTHK